MRRQTRGGIALAAALAVLGTTLAATTARTAARPEAPAAATFVERPGVVYGSAVNSSGVRQKLRLDLFLPTLAGRRPAVVLAHGGGFRRGSRKNQHIRRLAHAFAARGYVTASISYRLRPRRSRSADQDPSVTIRARSGAARDAQHDLQAAVRYLKRYRTSLGVDPRRIVALGASAGGIAALRAAYNPHDPGRSGNRGYGSRVAAVVSLWAAADPRMIERGAPPTLMFHGKRDTAVPFWKARRTCRATRNRGNLCRSIWWSSEGHSPWHRKREIIRTTSRYLRHHLN